MLLSSHSNGPLGSVGRFLVAPLPRTGLAAASLVVLLAGVGYCIAVGAMARGAPSLPYAALWAAITILPWYGAFEAGKRVLRVPRLTPKAKFASIVAVLATALALGVAFEVVLYAWVARAPARPVALHVIDHLPEMTIVGLTTLVAALLAAMPGANDRLDPTTDDATLPIAPELIRWVKAAGNYLEFGTDGRVFTHRMTMARAESLLAAEGFVRLHRSLIVPRRRIVEVARVRRGDVVVLDDGSRYKVGNAFRTRLDGTD